jgi:hypothetical protein
VSSHFIGTVAIVFGPSTPTLHRTNACIRSAVLAAGLFIPCNTTSKFRALVRALLLLFSGPVLLLSRSSLQWLVATVTPGLGSTFIGVDNPIACAIKKAQGFFFP